MAQFKLELGNIVVDETTTLEGKVTGRVEYLHAPNGYLVEGIDSTGRPIAEWITEVRLSIIGKR
jgi:hypothetical protein